MLKSKMNPRVFWGASLIIGALLAAALIAPGASDYAFGHAQDWVIDTFGWFYVASVAGFLLIVLWLAIGPTGRLKLGPDDCEPDFPYLSWLAMLFAAGMGIGLMYFAVAEPVQHYAAPPDAEPGTFAAAREAMVITFVHWGVHAWAIYAVVGLSLAYFAHRKGLPLTLRSGLHPLLGRRINGPIGDAVDVFAICGTLFGIATSLGLGVSQINSGLNYLTGLPSNAWVQVGLIVVVMAAATASVLTGLDRGVRRLSELNLTIAVGLMLFVLVVGPTGFLLKAFVQNFGLYLDHFFERTFNLYAYEPRGWMADWTLFYWAWWIAWSPFVGMFIARISRGRTVRQFVTGVLVAPTLVSLVWFAIFGGLGIDLTLSGIDLGTDGAEEAVLFTALAELPLAQITAVIVMVLVSIFFVSGADAASIVMGTLSHRGSLRPHRGTVVLWGIATGAVAAIMLLLGGEDALAGLQQITIIAALPFVIVMIGLAFALARDLSQDPLVVRRKYALAAVEHAVVAGVTEHGDDFQLTIEQSPPGEGVGELVPTVDPDAGAQAPAPVGDSDASARAPALSDDAHERRRTVTDASAGPGADAAATTDSGTDAPTGSRTDVGTADDGRSPTREP